MAEVTMPTFPTREAVDFVVIGSGSAGGIVAKELSNADRAILLEVYAASETPIPGVSSLTISKGMDASKVIFEPSMLKVVEEIAKNAKSGDVILTLGAGDVSSLAAIIVDGLMRRFP